nr:NADH dehydrogenase (ubiquinone) complex I, assembly factor 6-like isoform X3 [Dermacentor andersoni]
MFRNSLRTTAQYGSLPDKCIYYRSRVKCTPMSKLFKSSIAERGTSPAAYCMDQVKQYDYENYLCSLLLPAGLRRSAFAIRAFNVELAQIRDIVSRADIGLMRIRFWKDAVERVYKGNPPEHPVAQELSMMIQSKQLSRHWISRMIESRESILSDKPHSTVNELEEYAEKSVSSTLYFILQAMDRGFAAVVGNAAPPPNAAFPTFPKRCGLKPQGTKGDVAAANGKMGDAFVVNETGVRAAMVCRM